MSNATWCKLGTEVYKFLCSETNPLTMSALGGRMYLII